MSEITNKEKANNYIFISESPEDTFRLGNKIGSLLKQGDVVALIGELGSGKTYLAKGIAFGLNVPEYEYVNSPAFDLIHEHRGNLDLYHMDFYRMDYLSPEDYPWLEEYLYSNGVCVIEWADKFIDSLIESYLRIELKYDFNNENVRKIIISKVGNHYDNISYSLVGK
jgi:tRNA threonylcarbamoyladenosine biosynthesis protein TsaE